MPRIDDYKAAIALAAAALTRINPKRLEARTGARYVVEDARDGLLVPYFGQARRIIWPEIRVIPVGAPGDSSRRSGLRCARFLPQPWALRLW